VTSTLHSISNKEEQDGAWIVLSALEKAKEAELVSVARLVALLETTFLPGTATTAERTSSRPSSSFVSLPDVVARAKRSAESLDGNPTNGINGDDVRALLHATRHGKVIDLSTALALIEGATLWLRRFRADTKLVTLPPLQGEQTLSVIGDLHGSLSDLATVLEIMPGTEPRKNNLLLFNGDLADRGDHGIETICIVCALCLAYPKYVFVNRGNHEDLALAVAYGLVSELRTKYGPEPEFLTRALDAFFRSLPLATVIRDDALIVHAGPPPPREDHKKLADLLASREHPFLGGKGPSRTIVNSVGMLAPHIREDQEVIEALLWSDPKLDETGRLPDEDHHKSSKSSKEEDDDSPLGWHPNPSRGAGHTFDAGVVRRFLREEGLVRMIRSHEPVQRGCVRYEIPNEDSEKIPMELFTVFSASRYPRKEGFNQGAILELKANGQHKVQRYATEDDDPIVVGAAKATKVAPFASFHHHHPANDRCTITMETIRENLFEAIQLHEGAILRSLNTEPLDALHFERIFDILIQALNLEGDRRGLKMEGAKNVLAKALGIENTNKPVDLGDFSRSIARLSRDTASGDATKQHHPHVVSSLFDLQDETRNGHVDRAEWLETVASKMGVMGGGDPTESTLLEGRGEDELRELLDANLDRRLSPSEWERLVEAISMEDTDDEVLEG
jgi:diadenosine tetraphosphatase ApaH/serine/threonine PP2A family protein phosphatase